jgi:hypothetical protein
MMRWSQGGGERVKVVKIFVASPSDVSEERQRVGEVVKGINDAGVAARLGLHLELLRWETHVPPDLGRPQDIVFDTLTAKEWDVFLVVLWARFGTPSGRNNPKTGRPYGSGTEEEFETAIAERERRGGAWPRVMVYRCVRSIGPKTDPVQLGLVQEFFRQFEPGGLHPGLSKEYSAPDQFERLVRNDLERAIQDFVVDRPVPAAVENRSESPAPVAPQLARPGVLRYLFDLLLPRLHKWLSTRTRLLNAPAEWRVLNKYLTGLRAEIEESIRAKTYIDPLVKESPEEADRLRGKRTGFLTPVQQLIKEIVGVSEGGDAQSAQISALSRKSRFVRNVVRTLMNADEPLMLLGDPGTGKSLTLQQAAMLIAEREACRVFPTVCVFVRLGEFRLTARLDAEAVWDFVKKTAPAELRPYMDELADTGRLVIFFDGMDEMSRHLYNEHTSALSVFAGSRRESVRTLFSCRITDFTPNFRHKRLVLLPFGKAQIQKYLKRQVLDFPLKIGDRTWTLKQLAARLSERDLPMQASNPFVLWLLCRYLQDEEDWPKSRVHLLEYYNRWNFRRKMGDSTRAEGNIEKAFLGWAQIAYEVTNRNRGAAIPLADVNALLGGENAFPVTAGLQCGVLQESLDLDTTLLRFEHHRFEEFFTAYWLGRNEPVRTRLDWLSKLDAPRWQETLFNLVLMGFGDEALSALGQAIEQGIIALAPKEGSASNGAPNLAEEERLLADRIELAARVLQQVRVSAGVTAEHLFQTFRNAVYRLAEQGNPITQVKVLWACRQFNEIDMFRAARFPLSNRVSWVRQQALIITSSAPGEVSGQALKEDVLVSFASGGFLQRLTGYLRIAAALKQKRVWVVLAAGVLLSIAPLLAGAGLVLQVRRITPQVMVRVMDSYATDAQTAVEEAQRELSRNNTSYRRWVAETAQRGLTTTRATAVQVRSELPHLIGSPWLSLGLIAAMVLAAVFSGRRTPGWQMLAVEAAGLGGLTLLVLLWSLSSGGSIVLFFALIAQASIAAAALWITCLLIQTAALTLFTWAIKPWVGRKQISGDLLQTLWEECGFSETIRYRMFDIPLFFVALPITIGFCGSLGWSRVSEMLVGAIGLFHRLPSLLNLLLSVSLYVAGAVGGWLLTVLLCQKPRARQSSFSKISVFSIGYGFCQALILVIWGLTFVSWSLVFDWLGGHATLFRSLPLAFNLLLSADVYVVAGLILVRAARNWKRKGFNLFDLAIIVVWGALFAGPTLAVWLLTMVDWTAVGAFLLRFAFLRFMPMAADVAFSLIVYAEVAGCAALLIGGFVRGDSREEILPRISSWSLVCLTIAASSGTIWALISLGDLFARILAVLLAVVLVCLIGYMTLEFARAVQPWIAKWRAPIAMRYSPDAWIAKLKGLDPELQAVFLKSTTAETVGLRTDGYLKLLESVEDLVKPEPASSIYWATRFEVAEIVRQSKVG